MSFYFTPSPCVKTTKVFVLSRRRCWQERSVPLPCQQGAAHFKLLRPRLPRKYGHGELIPIVFRLTSVANGKPVTHAKAGLSVVMVADAKGNPTQKVVFEKTRAFKEKERGKYEHDLRAGKYAAGTYTVTIYGDAFPAFLGQFKILH